MVQVFVSDFSLKLIKIGHLFVFGAIAYSFRDFFIIIIFELVDIYAKIFIVCVLFRTIFWLMLWTN